MKLARTELKCAEPPVAFVQSREEDGGEARNPKRAIRLQINLPKRSSPVEPNDCRPRERGGEGDGNRT